MLGLPRKTLGRDDTGNVAAVEQKCRRYFLHSLIPDRLSVAFALNHQSTVLFLRNEVGATVAGRWCHLNDAPFGR